MRWGSTLLKIFVSVPISTNFKGFTMGYKRLKESDEPLTTPENKIIREQFPISKLSPRFNNVKHRIKLLDTKPITREFFYRRFYNQIVALAETHNTKPSDLLSKVAVIPDSNFDYRNFTLQFSDKHTNAKHMKHVLADIRIKRGSKECISCHKLLPFDQFYKDSTNLDGHTSRCKDCYNEYQRQYRKFKKEES